MKGFPAPCVSLNDAIKGTGMPDGGVVTIADSRTGPGPLPVRLA
jgi:hypothetical protein